ncbi:MAG: hypothetical protein ABIQ93_11265, partial [Saprospiraceae bacterium]
ILYTTQKLTCVLEQRKTPENPSRRYLVIYSYIRYLCHSLLPSATKRFAFFSLTVITYSTEK